MPIAALAIIMLAAAAGAQNAPSSFEALSRQADAARNAKQMEKALGLYRQALKLKPGWEDGLWSAGSIAYDLDRYSDCAPLFAHLAEVKPTSAPAWTMAGLCEYRLRQYDTALGSFTRVERLGFDETAELARTARLHYALLLTKAGSFEKAVTILTELTRIDRKSPETIVAAGIAGLRQPWLPSEVPEASRDLVYKLGDAMSSGMEMDYQEAERKFQAVAQQYDSEPNVHFRFGAFLNMQDTDRGIEEIKKTLERAPNHVLALVSLTVIYLKREDTGHGAHVRRAGREGRPGRFFDSPGAGPGAACQRAAGPGRGGAGARREARAGESGCALQPGFRVLTARTQSGRDARARRIQTTHQRKIGDPS